MKQLILSSRQVLQECEQVPFSVYSSIEEQRIFNVPIIKPMLICVLEGCKKIGKEEPITCPAGNFIFLSNSPNIDMRNIPSDTEYFALLIEFDFEDFKHLSYENSKTDMFFQGKLDSILQKTLQQFVEWSAFAPSSIWSMRKQEILQLIYHLGYKQVAAVIESASVSHRLHHIICADILSDLSANVLSAKLAMSESTLRRKLNAEGTSLQAIKDRAKLSHGLHLLQTSLAPIGHVAQQCGYLSQSRFTDRFKQLFGITPRELRKTRMRD
ncbi:helix-turn-helix transcriptional regulator [Agarilytica rhodophyticola]|uniref:helix-turn-helix transcriptional regulator n=1 Tax=Agarilytica rhodophyticola TaxID=1737490 RepID=UPI000B341845|nr:AraC family transcriptional regulator [Agarilytica rhodophyticola]